MRIRYGIGALVLLGIVQTAFAQKPVAKAPAYQVKPEWVRAHEEFLASDILQGRGSGTRDEGIAATYIGAQMRAFGIQPAGDEGGYVQRVSIGRRALASAPVLTAGNVRLEHGKEMQVARLSANATAPISGPLIRLSTIESNATIPKGAIVVLSNVSTADLRQATAVLGAKGAAVIILPAPSGLPKSTELPTLPPSGASTQNPGSGLTILLADPTTLPALTALPEGTVATLSLTLGAAQERFTYNAIGKLEGSDPVRAKEVILLTAHLDHLGIHPGESGDNLYNGADDDASGCTAVLELARALGGGPRPQRTVYFVFFGSEESGGAGARYFIDHPPVPLDQMVANLEFEMIGRPDAAVAPHTLWLTGYERTTLGPELARQGARLVADPHPEQGFFQRSDNIALARRGVVAQTVSSFGLHPQYHHPDDDLAHLDIAHMTEAINSMVAPVLWLVNTDYRPEWLPGKKP